MRLHKRQIKFDFFEQQVDQMILYRVNCCKGFVLTMVRARLLLMLKAIYKVSDYVCIDLQKGCNDVAGIVCLIIKRIIF